MRIIVTKNGVIEMTPLTPDNEESSRASSAGTSRKIPTTDAYVPILEKKPFISAVHSGDLFSKIAERNDSARNSALNSSKTTKGKKSVSLLDLESSVKNSSSILSSNLLSSSVSRSSNIVLPELPKINNIRLSPRKLNFPEELNELNFPESYPYKRNIKKEIYSQPVIVLSPFGRNGEKLELNKSKYSLGEIINSKCYDDLKKKIKKQQDFESHDRPLDYHMLRNLKDDSLIFKKIDEQKKLNIDAYYNNLIEYLLNKKSITTNLLSNLCKCDENKFVSLNKACQLMINREKKNKLLDIEIPKKASLSNFQHKLQREFLESSDKCQKVLDHSFEKIVENNNFFEMRKKRKEEFRKLHILYARKNWYKHGNYEHLMHKKQLTPLKKSASTGNL